MGKKIRLKRKSTIAVLSILACLVGLASWMAAFYHTNHLPYQIPDKIYQAGDFVPVGNNYFISPDENPDGYSVQVNDAKLLTYQQLFEQYNLDYHEYSRLDEYGNVESNYVYDIELNISNTDNTTGYIFFGRYLLVDKSLTLFYNSTIQALVYPELADVGSLKLKPGANKTLHFFFTPSTGAVQKRVRKVEKMLTEDVFSLCVSEFPARLLIKIKRLHHRIPNAMFFCDVIRTRTVDILICSLRRKLHLEKIIRTVPTVGYMLGRLWRKLYGW